jgi:hypothetical protein
MTRAEGGSSAGGTPAVSSMHDRRDIGQGYAGFALVSTAPLSAVAQGFLLPPGNWPAWCYPRSDDRGLQLECPSPRDLPRFSAKELEEMARGTLVLVYARVCHDPAMERNVTDSEAEAIGYIINRVGRAKIQELGNRLEIFRTEVGDAKFCEMARADFSGSSWFKKGR